MEEDRSDAACSRRTNSRSFAAIDRSVTLDTDL
jgi:hypothetical protein